MRKDSYRVFIDTAPLIYFLDNNKKYKNIVKRKIEDILANDGEVVISPVTCMEYLTFPYREERSDCINKFWDFVKDLNVNVCAIDTVTAEMAARIRGEYISFKGMDSLQLACSLQNECDEFITNDKQLMQFAEIEMVCVDSLSM